MWWVLVKKKTQNSKIEKKIYPFMHWTILWTITPNNPNKIKWERWTPTLTACSISATESNIDHWVSAIWSKIQNSFYESSAHTRHMGRLRAEWARPNFADWKINQSCHNVVCCTVLKTYTICLTHNSKRSSAVYFRRILSIFTFEIQWNNQLHE